VIVNGCPAETTVVGLTVLDSTTPIDVVGGSASVALGPLGVVWTVTAATADGVEASSLAQPQSAATSADTVSVGRTSAGRARRLIGMTLFNITRAIRR
jgi:hypothetical protein